MSYTVIPSVNIFIVKGSKVLLGRRQNTGWMDGYLCPPGGHVEAGERPLQAAVREIEEELGTKVNEKDLDFICVAARNSQPKEYVAYEFAISDKDYEFTNAEPQKCSELVWVEMSALPDDVIDNFRQVIMQGILGQKKFLELDF